jgi:hypothetical protein
MLVRSLFAAAVAVTLIIPATPATAAVRITEFMSEGQGDILQGNGGRRQREFFELTNLGPSTVDVSTWSWNDNNPNDPHNFGPAFGTLAAGESVVFTQMTEPHFRTYWGLPSSVRIFSYLQLSNLGNADTINIYNSFSQTPENLVDSLTYTADARGSGISRNRPFGGTGATVNADWITSAPADIYGSKLAPSPTGFPPNFPQPTTGFNPADYIDLANPGRYTAIPEPTTLGLLAAGTAAMLRRRK